MTHTHMTHTNNNKPRIFSSEASEKPVENIFEADKSSHCVLEL